jgi:glutaminyl-tRNA synthetase
MNFIEEKIIKKGNLDKLCFRFPPEPNGSGLHIGHTKSVCLNFGLALKYNAPCYLRFDDTNPNTERIEYVESMIDDIKWLGYIPTKITHTSDYFEDIYIYTLHLIKKGLAYVDDSSSDEIASLKGTPTSPGTNSVYRDRSIDINLSMFENMKNGVYSEGEKILRAKIDMSSPNMILRDPVLYRIIDKEHHNTGNTWKIYPMYDLAHPICDYIEGISDSLCTNEFEVHRPLYNWVLENLDLDNRLPEETEFARLNIDHTVLSKRKLKLLVEDGIVSGWDDPRMPTISGLKRRGYTPNSIKVFCETIGVTKKESVISHLLLEECLRTELNKTSNRIMCVLDPIKIVITNYEGIEYLDIENNPESDSTRKVPFSNTLYIERSDFREEYDNKYHRLRIGGEVRLKGAYVITANEIIKDSDVIKEVRCTYDPLSKSGMTYKKVKGTIHWVSIEHGINIEIRNYDNLYNEPTPETINEKSLSISNGIIEPNLDLCIGSVQFMRNGYYIKDIDSGDKIVFNRTVSLKVSY